METIRVVWGHASAPTAIAAYDAALAEAGVENYNLVSVSSVIPAEASVEAVGTAPDLGPIGGILTVVEARATSVDEPVSAALAWSVSREGPGLFYETGGEFDEATARERVERGIEAGQGLREWTFEEPSVVTVRAEPAGEYACAVVLAVYGRGRSPF
ncbi:pyruvoyl-dependent arginine decarboxylase [Natronorarus salvus]|uniref:pyruvoyl-dependent arginine decarboxylase n=1 Tax=Natronorarus salvus TaxID=3117733 RepID=UPI002F266E4D